MLIGRMFRGLALALLLVPAAAGAAPFSAMYVFGDSLSDNGNLYATTQALHSVYSFVPVVPAAPYYNGRFSNGPVAAEDIAGALGVSGNFHDFAYGGATSGVGNYADGGSVSSSGLFGLPGLTTEIGGYTSSVGSADANALYMVWAGANDFVAGSIDYALAVDNVKFAVQTLAAAGAQHILVPNLPDLALTPSYPGSTSAHDFTLGFNGLLASTLTDLNNTLGAHVVGFDTYSLFNQVLADPSAFGFANVTDPCYTGDYKVANSGTVCGDPSQYLFWDSFHPTEAGHQILANAMVAAVVPEPATVLLLVAGLLFIGLQVRRGRA